MEKKYKYICDVCYSILDVYEENKVLTFPCHICGNYSTIFYLQNSNHLFEIKNGDLCLVPSPLSEEEIRKNYENKNKRIRDIILGCLNSYKIGDGGQDTYGPCCPGETFSVKEKDFKKVVDMIMTKLGSM